MRATVSLPLTLLSALLVSGAPALAQESPQAPASVLLITSDELAAAWQPFAAWKTRQGKRTEVVSVQDIAERYAGQDIQEQIRACVHDYVATRGTRWVVLGGDSQGAGGIVPDRDTSHPSLRYRDIPTDLYYVTEGSWDHNGDGVFGEWRRDREAMRYDSLAAIGRIPVRTVADVAAYTEKVIAYERAYPEDEGFAPSLLYTCAVPQANYKSDLLWDQNLGPAWEGGQILRFFTDRSPWDQRRAGDYALSPDNWVTRINGRTASKMHMHGHGYLPGWVLERNQVADAGVVARLENRDAYLVMTTVSCFTGHYDDGQDPSIAESMLRLPGGGAVVVVAPSRPGVPIFSRGGGDPRDGQTQDGTTGLLTRFWLHGLSDEHLTAGEAFARARADYAELAAQDEGFHWVLCEINLLGDPTLDLRPQAPTTPALVGLPSNLSPGRRELTVQTDQAGGLTVCLWKGAEVYAVGTTDERGAAAFTIDLTAPGELLVTVSGPSVNTVTASIAVDGSPASQPETERRWFK
jgi:Peptidase family C25